jgi:type I restriction enzyme S subunit
LSSWVSFPISDLPISSGRSINPFDFPDEEFELYSVPSHEMRRPEIVLGKEIGSNKQIVSPGTVLLCKINPRINRTWIVGEAGERRQIASTEWIAFDERDDVDQKYLMFFMQQSDIRDFLAANASGVGGSLMRINLATLKGLTFRMPGVRTQRNIVEKLEELLSDLDAGVAELKAAQRKLAQYRQSLLKAAVEGALTADWRAAQNTSSRRRPGPSRCHEDQPQQRDPGLRRDDEGKETGAELLQRILRERRARWEQKQLAKFAEQGKTPPKGWQEKYPEPVAPDLTDLPPLPEGWVWASVDQVVSESLIGLDRGQEHQSESGSVGYIKMNNISMDGDVSLRNLVKIEADQFEIERYAVESGDLLFNTRNSKELVGKVGIVRSPSPMTVYNNNLMRIRFDGVVLPQFACHQLCGPEFRGRMERIKKATTSVAAVYAKDFFPLAFAVPPKSEQKEIESRLDAAFESIDQQRSAIEKAIVQSESQRKNILKAAFSGQLVPQDPNDEPASELLARIRAQREANPGAPTRKRGRKAKGAA